MFIYFILYDSKICECVTVFIWDSTVYSLLLELERMMHIYSVFDGTLWLLHWLLMLFTSRGSHCKPSGFIAAKKAEIFNISYPLLKLVVGELSKYIPGVIPHIVYNDIYNFVI